MNNLTNFINTQFFIKTQSGFADYGSSQEYETGTDQRFDLIAVNSRYNNINQDLVFQVKRKPGYLNSVNKLDFIKFNKNINDDNHLKKVTQSNGAIVDEIVYKPMDQNNANYFTDNTAIYPNVNLNRIPSLNLVDYTKNTSLGIAKYQTFKYSGYVINYSGLGSLGFQKTSRSSWYTPDTEKVIWTVSENDMLKRGALSRTYSKMRNRTEVFSFSDTSNLLTKTENEYNVPPNSFPYVLTLDKQTSTDELTSIRTEKSFKYSTDGFYLPTETTTKNYLGTTLEGTIISKTEFYPNSFGTGADYYIGRPDISKTITTAYGDTKSSYTKLSYTGSNVTQIEKRVGTDETSLASATEKIIETMDYFPNGNLKSKTILPTGFPATTPPISARTTSFTYDATNRFVKTSTDVEGLVTTNNGYHPLYGTVTSQTNPFGQTTTTTLDNWGKQTSVTDFLGKSITYTYIRANDLITTQQVGSDGSESNTVSDVLSRVIARSSKDMNSNWNAVNTLYNWKGQVIEVSEPYLTGTTFLSSISQYDDYGRTTKTTAHTGQITTYAYNGLTTTFKDGKITNTTVKNSNGHVVSTTELADSSTPNTINYTYDANGNLLTSNYGVTGMTMKYDLWGRKTDLIDPAAGTTTYKYNGYGEMLEETNPKGAKTTMTYNAVGKPLTKLEFSSVTAMATNIATTYTYDSTRKWLNSIAVTDPYGGNSTFNYTYDTDGVNPTFLLKKTVEDQETLGAKFTKELTFDDFGRPLTEMNKAEMSGKNSAKTTFNVYNNGVLKEIKETSVTGASIWKTETANARGQLTKGVFGNRIEEQNYYDEYGYFSLKRFQDLITNTNRYILEIDYKFEPIRGNLISRDNHNYKFKETFKYDSNDRLIFCEGSSPKIFQNCQFTNSLNEFYIASGDGLITNKDQSFLKATLTTAGTLLVSKKIISNAKVGDSFHISADTYLQKFASEQSRALVYITEKNIITNEVTSHSFIDLESLYNNQEDGFVIPYVVTSNSDLFINIELEVNFYGYLNSNTHVNFDNLIVSKVDANTQTYDNRGRITENELGAYGYPSTGKIYQNNRVKLEPSAQPYYLTDRSSQTITYNAYKCPIDITEAGKERISFGYNAMHDRSVMYYGSANTNKLLRPFRKFYSADGSMEIKYTLAVAATATTPATPASYQFVTYLGGDAYSAPAVVKSDGTTQNTFYLLRDNQSSILAVSNSAGTVIERRFFDAWGQLARFEKNGVETPLPLGGVGGGLFLDRGYTGHEHLLGVGLINMNARLYDPKLRRFLQTDNEVQDPSKAQDYNRYGYCLNNPLKYTDPSGNHPILIAVLISALAYVGKALIFNEHINAMGLITSSLTTGFTAVATFGIGTMVNTIGNFAVKTTVQTLAHGVFNGGMAAITGGNFWQGFAAGAVASLANSLYSGGQNTAIGADGQRYGIAGTGYEGFGFKDGVSHIVFGTISGGVGASLTGGNFWQGAATGLIIGIFTQFSQGMERTDEANYDPTKVNKSNSDDIATGDVINLHNNGSALDLWAQQSKPSNGTVEIHSHAYEQGLAGFTSVKEISTMLYNKSPTWKSMIDYGKKITLKLFACNSGKGLNSIASQISKAFKNVTVVAPTNYWQVHLTDYFFYKQLNYGSVIFPGKWKNFNQ